MVHELQLNRETVTYINQDNDYLYFGVAGEYGTDRLHVALDEYWDGLAVKVEFINGNVTMKRLLDKQGFVDVPEQVQKKPTRGASGKIRFVGTASGVRRIVAEALFCVGKNGLPEGGDGNFFEDYIVIKCGTSSVNV